MCKHGLIRPALIVVARVGDERLWAEVLNLGGYDVLAKPLDPAEVDYVISAACRQMGGGPITPDAMPVSQCWKEKTCSGTA